jgi:hypothetical protein
VQSIPTISRRRRRRLLLTAVFLVLCAAVIPRGSEATVEEQRARLPPPAKCADRVEGTWLALKYEPQWRDWYEHTLVIRRVDAADGGANASTASGDASGALVGDMIAHTWIGDEKQSKPPPCTGPLRAGQREVVIKMPGKGRIDPDGKVFFGASSYVVDKVICGQAPRYNPDNFSGTIDEALQEFQSVNNDNGRSVNEPVVFRRVACPGGPRRTTADPKPPAFAPRKWSCGK